MILYLSDFDLVGSGYMQISIALCKAMADRGYKITALGMGYDGSEHNWPFSIIPIQHGDSLTVAAAMMQNFAMLAKGKAIEPIEAVIVALDIPIQERMMMTIRKFADWPYIGIFPIESGPLCPSWAAILNNMTSRLVISQYGLQQMADAGVTGKFLPVGLDTASWRPPQPEERKALRESMGFTDDMMVVLTVADNQERKNLWAAAETIKLLMEGGMDPQWTLVTRVHSPVGWRMADLGWKLGIQEHVMPFERGLPFDRLWTLYAIADAFLLTSKAEGFCLLPGTTVWTTDGPQPIQDVTPGQTVYSHLGRDRVTNVMQREYRGDIVTLTPSLGLEPIRLTPEHPVLIARRHTREVGEPVWLAAGKVRPGDFLCWPTVLDGTVPMVSLTQHVEALAVEGGVVLAGRNQHGAVFPHPRAKVHVDDMPVDDSLMDILGLYISEGCAAPSGPVFCFDERETDLRARLAKAMDATFGIRATTTILPRHRAVMVYSDCLVGRFLEAVCGRGAHEKHIPSWALELPEKLAWRLLEALWLGDGCVQTKRQAVARYSTVSGELAEQVQFLLLRLGIAASLMHSKRGEYEVRIFRNDFPCVPFLRHCNLPVARAIKAKSRWAQGMRLIRIVRVDAFAYDGPVFNLEVEGSASYLTAGGIVHNCMPLIEAMSCGVPVVATDCTAISEQVFDDYPQREVARGFPIAVDYWNLDPWGNSMRAWASPTSAAQHLRTIFEWKKSGDPRLAEIVNRGIAYARSRTWDKTAAVLLDAVEEVKLRPAPVEEQAAAAALVLPANIQPLTVPRPVPVLGGRK